MDPNNKLDFDSISFDDVIGDGAPGVTEVSEAPTSEPTESLNELDEDIQISSGAQEGESLQEPYEDEYEEEEYEEEDGREDHLLVTDQISEALGVDLESEYADTVEGLTDYVRDMSVEVAETQLQELFSKYPEVQEHLDYVQSGGKSSKFFETYNPQSDYSNIEMRDSDVSLQRAMLGEYFQSKGHDNEFINDILLDYQESGKLFSKAQVAQGHLVEAQETSREAEMHRQNQAYEDAQNQETQFWEGVAHTIESGNEFAGISIPDRDKQDFFDYISQPIDNNGTTQRDIDYRDADMDIKLAVDYLMYSGFNLEDIISTKARTKSVESLRGRIQSNERTIKSARKAQRRDTSFDSDNLDITALF